MGTKTSAELRLVVKLVKQANLSFSQCAYVITWLCSPRLVIIQPSTK